MNETGVETYSDSPDRAIAFILAQEAILSVQANVWIQREGFLLGKGDAFLDEGTVSEVDLSGTYVSLSMIEDGAFRTVQVISSSSLGEQDGAMYLFLDLDPTPSKGRVIKLRPGERIMVGVTDNPMVSSDGVIPPKHVALSVTNAGTLCVENSSSKAVLHRSPVYNDVSTQVENIAKSIRRERLTYGESALADFKEFCQRHDYEIRRYEAAGDVQGLRDFIRSLFLLGYEGKRPYGEQVYNLTEESLHDIYMPF